MRAKQRWLQNIVYQVPLKAYEGIAKGPCAHWSPEKRQENGRNDFEQLGQPLRTCTLQGGLEQLKEVCKACLRP